MSLMYSTNESNRVSYPQTKVLLRHFWNSFWYYASFKKRHDWLAWLLISLHRRFSKHIALSRPSCSYESQVDFCQASGKEVGFFCTTSIRHTPSYENIKHMAWRFFALIQFPAKLFKRRSTDNIIWIQCQCIYLSSLPRLNFIAI